MKQRKKRVSGILLVGFILFFVSYVSADIIYSTGNDGTALIKIDTLSGVGTVIGPAGYEETWAAAFTPDGTLWTIINGFTNGQLATFDLSTGAATPVGDPWGTNDIIALEASASGTLYAAGFDGSFYSVDTTTGQLTYIGDMGFLHIMDMAFDNAGTLWAVASDPEHLVSHSFLYKINPSTGAGTYVCTITDAEWVMGIMVNPISNTMYVTNYGDPAYLYTLNPTTCAVTQIGSGLGDVTYPHGGDMKPVEVAAVPALTGWGSILFMFIAGAGSIYYFRRRGLRV